MSQSAPDFDEAGPFDEQGQPPRVFRPERALPSDIVRPTRAEIHLGHLRHNLHGLKKVAAPAEVWPVIKADAYGHGSKAVARTLERAGADGFCVSLIEEGVELREAGIEKPILVMGGYYRSAFRECAQFQLTPVLHEIGQIDELSRALMHAARQGHDERVSVHLKLDTGMARLGIRPEEFEAVQARLRATPQIEVSGLMSHLAQADDPDLEYLLKPLRRFEAAIASFAENGQRPRYRHLANSAALLRHRPSHFDLVRPGLAIFGVMPFAPGTSELPESEQLQLKPTFSLRSEIIALRRIQVGESTGYGGHFRAERPTLLATVPVGYADGLSRALSARGEVLVRGQRAKIAGVMSMDMTVIDVTDHPEVALGDEVMLLGSQKNESGRDEITVRELADRAGMIPWEIITNISRRVPRFYLND